MTGWDLSRAVWRTSSHSGEQGGECVEVAALWRKSSHSGEQGGTCVEVAGLRRAIAVRDSKDPDGPALRFTPAEWSTFLTAVKNQA
jgi:hypothetical protein